MNENLHITVFRYDHMVLDILAAIGLVGYGILYLILMPQVSPDASVPIT